MNSRTLLLEETSKKKKKTLLFYWVYILLFHLRLYLKKNAFDEITSFNLYGYQKNKDNIKI